MLLKVHIENWSGLLLVLSGWNIKGRVPPKVQFHTKLKLSSESIGLLRVSSGLSLSKELGYTEQEMHETIKDKYDIGSTKQLSVEEFTELIEAIKRWAVIDMGIVLPNARQPHQ